MELFALFAGLPAVAQHAAVSVADHLPLIYELSSLTFYVPNTRLRLWLENVQKKSNVRKRGQSTKPLPSLLGWVACSFCCVFFFTKKKGRAVHKILTFPFSLLRPEPLPPLKKILALSPFSPFFFSSLFEPPFLLIKKRRNKPPSQL